MRPIISAAIFLMLLVNLLALPSIVLGDPLQWQIEDGGNGHWYDSVVYTSTWDEAKAHAENQDYDGMRGHLVTITSKEEQDFVWRYFPYNFWLGGYQNDKSSEPQGNWIWVTGEKWAYTNWRDGEPNDLGGAEDCLEFYGGDPNGKWSDFYRTSINNGYIIEYGTKPVVPSEPKLIFSTLGVKLNLSWTTVSNSDGYLLSYAPAPYEGPTTIRSIDMVSQTSLSIDLWDGASFFLAVQAYNSAGMSGYSNIGYFFINRNNISVTPSDLSLSQGESKTCDISGGTKPYSYSAQLN